MLDISKTSLGIAAGVIGTLFVGYCVYFDQKRRKDPDFKKKLRERRKKARQTNTSKSGSSALPNLKDHQAVQEYFLQQIQLGEELLVAGNLDEGIEHFGRAIAFCGQPNKLLEVLQQSMSAPVFHLLVQRLPGIMQQCSAQQQGAAIQDDDLE